MPKLERSKPPFAQIADHLRARILRGDLAPGTAIPTLRAIADDWGVSQVTVSKAIGRLQDEGLVKIGGTARSTIVQDPKGLHRSGQDRAVAVRRTGRIYSPGEYARIVSAEVVAAPADVAAALGLTGDSPQAIRRVRVTYGPDDQPVSASTSWYHADLIESSPRLMETERIREGSWNYVETQTGQRVAQGRDEITVRLATQEDADILGLELPAAIKVSTTKLWTGDDVVIEYGISIAGAGRASSYEYDLPGE